MQRTRTGLFLAPALSLGLLSSAAAQTATVPAPAAATPAAAGSAVKRPAAEASPGAGAITPVPTAKPSGPITLLETPQHTPVMPKPPFPSVAAPTPGNAPAGSTLPPPGVPPVETGGTGLGNLPSGVEPSLRDTPGMGTDSSVLPGTPGAPLPETPDTPTAGGAGANEPPGAGITTPLLAHTPEQAPELPPTPVPVLPLSILYGVILLFAGGYFWYTARLHTGDEDRTAT